MGSKSKKTGDDLAEESADAVVNLLMTKLAHRGFYEEVLNAGTAADRRLIEQSLERHAGRRRAAGDPGW
jgi:hypothetical protein